MNDMCKYYSIPTLDVIMIHVYKRDKYFRDHTQRWDKEHTLKPPDSIPNNM